ncbi:DUF1292 domain-containing protein [Brotaphodocola sp.]|uniref:DUF1292 domain-containing protein n=1 Tax=Brotaphodocola sp. TaxID=3073577 RepID=UPI003D7DCD1E
MADEDLRKEQSDEHRNDENLQEEGEPLYMDIEFPDGRVVEYEIIGTFGIGENRYLAMYPTEQEGGMVNLFPIEEGPDGNLEFREFFDDEEYEVASEFFETWVNEGADALLESVENPTDIIDQELDMDDME